MAERRAVTKEMVARYRKASKKAKGHMLEQLCALTGWNRDHARKALRHALLPPAPKKPRSAPVTYGQDVMAPLRKIWATLDAPAGKRLAPFLPEIVMAMEQAGELTVSPEIRAKLLRISAATIDRLLAPDRRRLQIKGRSGTKPGSLLRAQIPIRTFAEWDEARPGFLEVDLVAHDGGDNRGQFCQTLTLTDVATGWTEARALPNKAQRWVLEALVGVSSALPFPLLGVDSDNGSEFINDLLFSWCTEHGVTFTRTRAWRKNDNCYVEQKNWSVVRRAVGYLRYDTAQELGVLRELYGHLRLYVNFFQPQMKLLEKTRTGAKVRRRYDTAQTPYQRILASPRVSSAAKATLTTTYRGLNPVALKREIASCQDRLMRLAKRGKPPALPSAGPGHPWREYDPRGFSSRASSVRQRPLRRRAS